jgi:hypothetical protein
MKTLNSLNSRITIKFGNLFCLIALLVWFGSCNEKKGNQSQTNEDHSLHQPTEESLKPSKSPKKTAMKIVDGNHIHIDYSSPSVRGRQIFGGLVAYGEVWATGAHKATWIQFDKPVTIGDKTIPAGKYGLFTIPGEKEWTVIINEVWDMHLADDYDASKDVVRFTCTPEKLETTVESLTYQVEKIASQTTQISISWEKTKIKFIVKNS